jgi:hypothetical protein
MISTCANPDCKTTFDYRHGRFFRFHKASEADKKPNTHCVQHFWLCGSCSAEFTLVYESERGVVMLPGPELLKQLGPRRFVAAA